MLTWISPIAFGWIGLLAPSQAEEPLDGVIRVAEEGSGQVIVAVGAGELEAVVAGVPVRDVDALAQPVGGQEHHGQGEGCNAGHLQQPKHGAAPRSSILSSKHIIVFTLKRSFWSVLGNA